MNFSEILFKIQIFFIEENTSESVVYKTDFIFMSHCGNRKSM